MHLKLYFLSKTHPIFHGRNKGKQNIDFFHISLYKIRTKTSVRKKFQPQSKESISQSKNDERNNFRI